MVIIIQIALLVILAPVALIALVYYMGDPDRKEGLMPKWWCDLVEKVILVK